LVVSQISDDADRAGVQPVTVAPRPIWGDFDNCGKKATMKAKTAIAGLIAILGAGCLPALLSRAEKAVPQSARAATRKPVAGKSLSRLQKRWLFVWRDMSDPKEVDRMIARFPDARAAGYNGVAFSHDVVADKAASLREAAKKNGLDLVAMVMGGGRDRNYVEGVVSKDALFLARGGRAEHKADNPTTLLNGGFESSKESRFADWPMQDDPGVTTFADTEVKQGGSVSLRMESIGKNTNGLCRLAQPLRLQPHRQYLVSFWIKTENLRPAVPEVKVLTDSPQGSVSWQTFRVEPTQDWKQYHIVFNSLDETAGRLYFGLWGGKEGKIWWDELAVREIGLTNVLRRPGCPITVRGEDGAVYEENKDFDRVSDPMFHPYIPYRGSEPAIKLTANSRIKDGDRLRVTYYHPIVIYADRLTYCISEPKIFDDWRDEVKRADELLHPKAFFMLHDEMRVMNQCASCRAKNMTAGELLAWNVKKAAQIIRDIRPEAEIWVWSDMFDPQHNAVDRYYAVNGSLKGSWKGLDKDVGTVNWHGGLQGKNSQFFADLGLKQILSGYYDGDEDGSQIKQWIQNTKNVPNIVGAMYTTWEDKYGAMGVWAESAWGKRK
jgi:hypothetical protein